MIRLLPVAEAEDGEIYLAYCMNDFYCESMEIVIADIGPFGTIIGFYKFNPSTRQVVDYEKQTPVWIVPYKCRYGKILKTSSQLKRMEMIKKVLYRQLPPLPRVGTNWLNPHVKVHKTPRVTESDTVAEELQVIYAEFCKNGTICQDQIL